MNEYFRQSDKMKLLEMFLDHKDEKKIIKNLDPITSFMIMKLYII